MTQPPLVGLRRRIALSAFRLGRTAIYPPGVIQRLRNSAPLALSPRDGGIVLALCLKNPDVPGFSAKRRQNQS